MLVADLPDAEVIDRQQLEQMLDVLGPEDSEVFLKQYLSEAASDLQRLTELCLQRADVMDTSMGMRIAHAMKGRAAQLGFLRSSHACQNLQKAFEVRLEDRIARCLKEVQCSEEQVGKYVSGLLMDD